MAPDWNTKLPVIVMVPGVPGEPGSNVPPLWMVTVSGSSVPVPAKTPPLTSIFVASLAPLRTTVPELTSTALMPVKP